MSRLVNRITTNFGFELDAMAVRQIRVWAKGVERQMQARAPVRTGRLKRGTINTRVGRSVVIFRSTAPYASFIHYGTQGRTRRAFFTITRAQKLQLVRIYSRALGRYVRTRGPISELVRAIRRISPIILRIRL